MTCSVDDNSAPVAAVALAFTPSIVVRLLNDFAIDLRKELTKINLLVVVLLLNTIIELRRLRGGFINNGGVGRSAHIL